MKRLDLTGQRYGRLVVVGFHDTIRNKCRYLCRCDCGKEVVVVGNCMRRGTTFSCGCYAKERRRAGRPSSFKFQGLTQTPVGRIWRHMMDRCLNEDDRAYRHYGGRGIKVCEFLSSSPSALLALIGEKPFKDASIDRIDNDGNYSCGRCSDCEKNEWEMNVRWASKKDQARNRRNTRSVTMFGVTKCLAEWSEQLGLSYPMLLARIRKGWPAQLALITPPHSQKSKL